MKSIALGAVLAGLAIGAAAAQGTSPPGTAAESGTQANPHVCLWTYLIDHTTVVDAKTLVFHMKDKKAWKNTLVNRCPDLKFHGYAYLTHDGQICANSQAIYVLKTHSVCMLGGFEPYVPPPKDAPAEQAH